MAWLNQMKACLSDYYSSSQPSNIVGYLKGSSSPSVWKSMAMGSRPKNQMVVLGNIPPSKNEWEAAGVDERGEPTAITEELLGNDWIILYGGFMYRPWGKLFEIDDDALNIGFPSSLESWRRNS